MENKDKPAMPVQMNDWHGLTKREYFAAKAMQALVAKGNIELTQNEVSEGKSFEDGYAIRAVLHADALLKALEGSK